LIRLIIVTVAVVLALFGANAAFSHTRGPDPGPAIVLDQPPVDDVSSPRDGERAGRASGSKRSDSPKQDSARSSTGHGDGAADHTFTVAQPQPIEAHDDSGDADETDKPDDDRDTDEPDEPDGDSEGAGDVKDPEDVTPN
jgi:hypothetical protein